jgi:hypothetical protein
MLPKSRSGVRQALVFGILLWFVIVLLSGAGFNLFPVQWDFSRTGGFGDSFGVVGAVMTTVAGYYAFNALIAERRSAQRLRSTERRRSRIEHERDAEGTLFQLMNLRLSVAREISLKSGATRLTGSDALSHMAKLMSSKISKSLKDSDAIYASHYEKWKDQLGHYFRLTYHIVKFADENFPTWKAYTYVRLLRAQLSNSEQVLLALNCAHGEGRSKFKGAVEYYALLHNIAAVDRSSLALDVLFEPGAFDYLGESSSE